MCQYIRPLIMKNEDNHRLIAFLEACYKSDNREQLLYNYQGNTVEHKKMLTDTELLTGDLAFLPLTANYGEKLALELSSYRFEKALYLLPFFLTGGKTTDGKTVCAPLFFIPANLAFEDEMYKIYPEFENTQVNPAFFRLIEATDEDDVSSIAEMLNLLNGDALTFEKVAKMQRLLQKRYPALHSNDMLLYPNLASKIQSTGAAQLKVVSCCGMGILRKSSHTVHVQKELESLVQSKFLSPPLRQFLQLDKGSEKPLDKDELKLVPAMLNKAQLNAIDHAKKYSSSVVIGPPGTGKSYTIAAMAVEAAMQGKSVLITSAKNQAVDVVKHKIENDFGIQDLCMRAGGKGDYKADFKRRFENLLNGIGIEMVDQNELQSLMSDLNKTNKRIAQLEREYEKAGIQAIKLGKRLQRNTKGLWAYIAAKTSKWAMNKYAPMWQTLPELEALYPEKLELLKKIIQLRFKHNVFLTMRKRRNMVKVFAAALRARTIQTKEARFSQVDFSQLKTAFPIWLVNLSECANVLPLSQ
ncbi:AAA family ATPase, partial [bacterium]|nr:AAA family ATPase [bacterium]